MNTVIHTPQILLFSELEEPQDYEIYIYGTSDCNKLHHDSFGLALDRYLREINISRKTLSRLTGIAPSTISRYLSGKRKICYDYLCVRYVSHLSCPQQTTALIHTYAIRYAVRNKYLQAK